MASLRIQGLPDIDTFNSTAQRLKDEYKLLRWKIAAQSEKYWEATFTFESVTVLKKATQYLQKLLADKHDQFEGVVIDTTFIGVTVLHSNNPAVE
jgi:hypothetical protein